MSGIDFWFSIGSTYSYLPYPLAELELANRVAVIGMAEGWGEAYTRAAYEGWFERGEPAGGEPNLSAAISATGQDVWAVLERANGPEGIEGLAAATGAARALGIFGSPTFVVDRELFWGDDRLDDASNPSRRIECAVGAPLPTPMGPSLHPVVTWRTMEEAVGELGFRIGAREAFEPRPRLNLALGDGAE
jgi:2-hydroxychromene-2-carboxylate isomerase